MSDEVKLTDEGALRSWERRQGTSNHFTAAREIRALREVVRACWLVDNLGLVLRKMPPSDEHAAWIRAVLAEGKPETETETETVTVKLRREDAGWLAGHADEYGRKVNVEKLERIFTAVRAALGVPDE